MSNNRWGIALAGILMQVALGAVYAWSVFRTPLVKQFHWSIAQVTLTFTICIMVLGFSSFFGGLWLNRNGPRVVALTAGFLYGLGTGQISDLDALNGDVGEIVRDFTEISRATGDDADEDESNEQAYAELVEFIRVAAQVVFEELLPLREQSYPTVPQRLH